MKRILFFTAFISALAARAQQTDTADLAPVEVKTIRAGATSPFAKTNISKMQIQAQNLGQDLPFILSQTPSVVINSDAGNGIGYTGIRIRGTDATRINVTINGIPFNDPESGGAFFVNLPDILSSASSIQIQRGVGTSTNGGGAFGGTINLSTNDLSKAAYFESNNSYGSFSSMKNNIRFGSGLVGGHFTTDVRFSKIKSNGYIERAKTDLQSYYLSTAYIDDRTSVRFTNFSGKEKTYQAWNGVAEVDLKGNRRVNYAGTEKQGVPYSNETDNYNQDHYQLLFTQKLSAKWDFTTSLFYIKGKGYYEQYKAGESYSDYGLPPIINGSGTITNSDLIRQLWLDNDFYGAVFSSQYVAAKSTLSIGGSLSNYLGNHFGKVIWAEQGLTDPNHIWYNNDAIKNDWNVYGKLQYRLSQNLQAFTDLQLRGVNYSINGFRNNPTIDVDKQYRFFNPKAGLTYTMKNWTLFASYSIGNREPVRDDFEAAASEAPKPENLQDWELGVEKKWKNTSVGATLYYMQYRNQLVLTGKINDVGAYTRTNIDDSYRAGIELQGAAVISQWLKASANLTLSRNKVKNFTEFVDDYDNGGQKSSVYKAADISFSPNVMGAATITFNPLQKLSIDWLSKYVGTQYLDNTGNAARRLNAYYTQDVRAAYSFTKGWLKNADIIFQVNNLFDKKYEPNGYTFSYYSNNKLATENYYFPMAGINWMVGLNVRL
ncbi:MAG: TonB-dependent receptor [Flavisolibacter sp.]|jgi:iron complex outermembrane receptor protein|nr:TonB-dependent receptor [Flavisolibacter sp.]